LLGIIIEKVTGQTWEEALSSRIFNPLTMLNSNSSVKESQENEDFSYSDKTDNCYRAIFYGSQRIYCCLREYLILSDVSQNLECLIEGHEKRNRRNVRIRQERIIKVYLKKSGVRVPALDVRFPKQESKSADADEHNDYLKKYC